ncbi:MAG: type II toxin-antitoxin system HicB family antitoxin [Firmicutes bacterium]|nr:type II toxin-antitoxin system HicB family antitoxin [Bacillota bacterium]
MTNYIKDINYYLSLPYTKIVTKRDDEDGIHYTSHILELRGCISDGETPQLALDNLQEALECYLESCIAHNDNIPEPLRTATV